LENENFLDEVDRLYQLIELGRQGLNIGMTTGINKLDEQISGIEKQTFYLIGGQTGSGKTTLCLYSFIYMPLKERLGDLSFRILYFSLEMSAPMLLAKLLSMYIYDEYGVIVTYKEILSRKQIISDEKHQLVIEGKKWLKKVKQHLAIYDKKLTSVGLDNILMKYSLLHGEYEESANGNTRVYKSKLENELVQIVLDHAWLISTLPGQDKKSAVDQCAQVCINYRNRCGYSPIFLQQLGRQSSSVDRRKQGTQLPELQDFKGTGDIAEAAEVVLALFNPFGEKMATWEGYSIKTLRDAFRAIVILKQRFGEVNVAIPTSFFGNVGMFKDIPTSEEIRINGNDYEPFLTIDYNSSIKTKDTLSVKKDENLLFTL
jgi:hypothetical protein